MTTFFISGHLDLTQEEFDLHYMPRIKSALEAGADFVVGDARGADYMAQVYLATYPASTTVYHMLVSPRNNVGFPAIGGFKTDEERDRMMTQDSDRDIAWIRPGRSKSGTAKNLQRRMQELCSKNSRIYSALLRKWKK